MIADAYGIYDLQCDVIPCCGLLISLIYVVHPRVLETVTGHCCRINVVFAHLLWGESKAGQLEGIFRLLFRIIMLYNNITKVICFCFFFLLYWLLPYPQ